VAHRHFPTATQPVSLGWRPRPRSCKPRTKLQKKASYTDMKAMVFLVAATTAAAERRERVQRLAEFRQRQEAAA